MYKARVRLYTINKDNNLVISAYIYTDQSNKINDIIKSAYEIGNKYLTDGSHDAFDFELIY